MSRLPTLATVQSQLDSAVSIADVFRLARSAKITRVACGYRIERPIVTFTESDRAWFRAPIAPSQEGK